MNTAMFAGYVFLFLIPSVFFFGAGNFFRREKGKGAAIFLSIVALMSIISFSWLLVGIRGYPCYFDELSSKPYKLISIPYAYNDGKLVVLQKDEKIISAIIPTENWRIDSLQQPDSVRMISMETGDESGEYLIGLSESRRLLSPR